jgi:hypothetical protein
MRTVIARLTIVAACAVCLELLGALDTVALAQTSGTRPGGTTPATTTPGTQPGPTTPGTTTPGAGTTPGTTTPGAGASPGTTSPGTQPGTTSPGTTPGTGTTPGGGTGQPGSQAAADPFLMLLQAFFDAVQQFVQEEFPDASPEFQDWLTNAVMDFLFGDLIAEAFGGPANSVFGGGGR